MLTNEEPSIPLPNKDKLEYEDLNPLRCWDCNVNFLDKLSLYQHLCTHIKQPVIKLIRVQVEPLKIKIKRSKSQLSDIYYTLDDINNSFTDCEDIDADKSEDYPETNKIKKRKLKNKKKKLKKTIDKKSEEKIIDKEQENMVDYSEKNKKLVDNNQMKQDIQCQNNEDNLQKNDEIKKETTEEIPKSIVENIEPNKESDIPKIDDKKTNDKLLEINDVTEISELPKIRIKSNHLLKEKVESVNCSSTVKDTSDITIVSLLESSVKPKNINYNSNEREFISLDLLENKNKNLESQTNSSTKDILASMVKQVAQLKPSATQNSLHQQNVLINIQQFSQASPTTPTISESTLPSLQQQQSTLTTSMYQPTSSGSYSSSQHIQHPPPPLMYHPHAQQLHSQQLSPLQHPVYGPPMYSYSGTHPVQYYSQFPQPLSTLMNPPQRMPLTTPGYHQSVGPRIVSPIRSTQFPRSKQISTQNQRRKSVRGAHNQMASSNRGRCIFSSKGMVICRNFREKLLKNEQIKKRKQNPSQSKTLKRQNIDVLHYEGDDDDDCQVICTQPKNTDGGLPQIQSVEGGTKEFQDNSTNSVHILDSVTLSISKSKPSNSNVSNTTQMATILASHGVTITPKPIDKEKSSEDNNKTKVSSIDFNGAVTLIPSNKSNKTNNNEKPAAVSVSNITTVDLTDDVSLLSPSKPLSVTPANRKRVKKNCIFKCDLCLGEFPYLSSLTKHRQHFHRVGISNCEMGIPLINLKQPEIFQKLSNLGINKYIPIPNVDKDGYYCLPIISSNNSGNISELGVTKFLTLGPIRIIPKHHIPNGNVISKQTS